MKNTSPIQTLIDLPELQQYYHAENSPDRIPLLLVCQHKICKRGLLEKFGVAVEVMDVEPNSDRPFLEITDVEETEEKTIIRFEYAVEGVRGAVELYNSDNSWNVISQEISEY